MSNDLYRKRGQMKRVLRLFIVNNDQLNASRKMLSIHLNHRDDFNQSSGLDLMKKKKKTFLDSFIYSLIYLIFLKRYENEFNNLKSEFPLQ